MDSCFSDWRHVTGGVSQRSVLGFLLFVIDITILDDNVDKIVSNVADHTKTSGRVYRCFTIY